MTIRYELESLHRNTPDVDLLEDLKRVAHELGSSTVTIRQYDGQGRFSASTLQRRFVSWHAALERAGLIKVRNVNQRRFSSWRGALEAFVLWGNEGDASATASDGAETKPSSPRGPRDPSLRLRFLVNAP